MEKVKVFIAWNLATLEKEYNEWMAENEAKISILQRLFSFQMSGNNCGYTITLFYRLLQGEKEGFPW